MKAAATAGILLAACVGVVGNHARDSSELPATPTAATDGSSTGVASRSSTAARNLDRQTTLHDEGSGAAVSSARYLRFAGTADTYVIGKAVRSGTYASAAPASGTCTWARLGELKAGIRHVLAQATTTGPSQITIMTTDRLFTTSGCATWQRVR